MRVTALDKALPAIAGFIADRTGIKIVRSHQAATDNKVIYLPHRRSELDLSEKDLVESVAFLYHEGGHMLYSNFSLSATNSLQRAITGTLEDIRIENLIMSKFPGARRNLSRLIEIMVSEGAAGRSGFPMMQGEESEPTIFQRYILYRLRYEVLRQQPMKAVAENAIAVARSKLPATMLTRLDALMFQVTDCTSEDEVFELSDLIIAMIKDEKKKEEERKQQQDEQKQNQQQQQQVSKEPDGQQPGQSEPEDGDDDGDGSNDDTSTESESESSSEPGLNQSASGTEQESESDDEAGDSINSSSSGGLPEAENASEALGNILDMSENDVQEDLGELLQAALNAAAAHEPRNGVSVPMPNNLKADIPPIDVDLAKIRGSINAVRTRTLQWMESVSEEDVVHSHSGMQIDSSRIWSGRLGGSVFVRKDEGIDLNAAVSIVVDRSGSMADIIGQAAQAAVATMLAFDVPGIKTQVTVFPWHDGHEEGVSVIKRWEESPRQLAGRVSNLSVSGCTPMAEAILFAASDISRRDESLKIVMVVTDGDPDDREAAVHVIERARESGITVVALGIGVDPSGVFSTKYASMIKDVGELSSSMVRLVKTAFEDRRTLQ